MPRIKDLAGQTFGRLSVNRFVGTNHRGNALWECGCKCSTVVVAASVDLLRGHTKSCGCLQRERAAEAARKSSLRHGLHGNPVCKCWHNMIDRCYESSHGQYKDYGGRGIRVCEWIRVGPEHLVDLMWNRPAGKVLDRIDNNGHYSCGQCAECKRCSMPMNLKWSTRQESARNTRANRLVDIDGVVKTITEWQEITRVDRHVMLSRIRAGRHPLVSMRNKKEVSNS